MKAEALIYAMTDIRDNYVTEYAMKTGKANRTQASWKKWVSIAACFAVLVLTASLMFAHFGRSAMDDPRGGLYHSFTDYAELCSILPEDHILQQLPITERTTISCEGYYAEEAATPATYADYYHIYVNIENSDSIGARIHCEANLEMSMDDFINTRKPFDSISGEVQTTTIEGKTVHFALMQYSDGSDPFYQAVFSVDEDFYVVSSATTDQAAFLEFITDLLTG